MHAILTETDVSWAAHAARLADKATLAKALRESRAQTLRGLQAYAQALGPSLTVPYSPELNPPLWEAGHIAWFADWWIVRNPHRGLGLHADPQVSRQSARLSARGVDVDALYDSSRVAHQTRWHVPLLDLDSVQDDLLASLDDTLAALQAAQEDDQGLYLFRLALLHEDMHAEAAAYMAQTLGLDVPDEVWPNASLPASQVCLASLQRHIPAQSVQLAWQGPGFAFDNECLDACVAVDACTIDAQAVRWAAYLPFIEAGGYDEPRWWSPAGWTWRQTQRHPGPRYLQRRSQGWFVQHGSRLIPLDEAAPACHLTMYEAQAWCTWAGRRLPTEAEWVAAALAEPPISWGEVWEWTSSPFAPFAGFTPHPYQDYSQPWFDGRPVLKGASRVTHPRMRHPLYRNYFAPERNDIVSGFRSVAL